MKSTAKISKDEQTTASQKRLDPDIVSPDSPIDPRPLPSHHNRHLDVDRVLARSLPMVSGETGGGSK